ncbi:RNA helicase Mov10l1-like [Mizuhopecten yessoensis]|uniref:RNA helicase n=1 Tax=Mizuhopecten yessoensis TaxID=6573 RepID=A0A210QJ86_MIZYE|nr:RNA helicase Mov10l1-like [Mizuhopecten yessoensis]OWF48746.1 helicase Mov10l1 [Mizuhopecten yessoensis]
MRDPRYSRLRKLHADPDVNRWCKSYTHVMFSVLSKVVNYFWTEEGEDGNDNEHLITSQTNGNVDPKNESLSDTSVNNKSIDGKVTHLYNTHGLIDNEIYFSFDAIQGDQNPVRGDHVTGVAKQQHTDGGWHADQVILCSDFWDQEGNYVEEVDHSEPDAVVGVVTHFKGTEGYISDYIHFTFQKNDVGENNFFPCNGDYVTADIAKNDAGQTEGRNIQPVRVEERDGQVTGALQNHGYIEGEVFFSYDVCKGGWRPKQWDKVKVVAVESVQGRNNWRAISVEPVTTSYTPSAKFLISPTRSSFLEDLQRDKNGIVVSMKNDYGDVQIGETKKMMIWIENKGKSPQLLQRCHFPAEVTQLRMESMKLMREHAMMTRGNQTVTGNITLYPAASLYINILLEPRSVGLEKQLLIFTFKDFRIGRYITANIQDAYSTLVTTGSQYQQQKRNAMSRYRTSVNTPAGWTIPGEKPSRVGWRKLYLPSRLPTFPVPERLRDSILEGDDLEAVVPVVEEELGYENYTARFKTLLHLEEIQMDIDIREFDLERVSFRPVREFLALKVPGLAEGRPSILIGDRIIVTDPGDSNGPAYEGYVHELMSEDVLVKFSQNFHQTNNGKDFNVVFTFNRASLRRCHQAVSFAVNLGENVVFPATLLPKLSRLLTSNKSRASVVPLNYQKPASNKTQAMSYYNQWLNDQQKAAVTRVLQGQCRPLPYILFGPPGTGKTMTIVETIIQVLKKMPSSRILACTPSNSAADLIAERIHKSGQVKTSDMVRLNAVQRNQETVPNCVRPYCCYGDNLDLASHYRVVVSTCASAGILYTLGIQAGHFSHVFVDEAGQATEPECMISCGMVAGADGQIVLAGDPMQLGPVLRSKHSSKFGLELSFLERLINMPLYQRNESMFADHGCFDPLLVTKLVDNYRSHQAILSLSSQLFYNAELREQADRRVTHALCDWHMLTNTGFPVLFHGIRGEDSREGDSPSWFNPAETVLVVRYLQGLMRDEKHQVAAEDVGVITPYRKQVEKIRLLIDKLGMDMVKVGSVEEFQGQEKPVIIISTVRSTERLIGFDMKHSLGFLSNPKRFNVAISRAQCLLIIIGNPFVLSQDKYWQTLIHYCIENHAYTGCDLPDLSQLEEVKGQGRKDCPEEVQDTLEGDVS